MEDIEKNVEEKQDESAREMLQKAYKETDRSLRWLTWSARGICFILVVYYVLQVFLMAHLDNWDAAGGFLIALFWFLAFSWESRRVTKQRREHGLELMDSLDASQRLMKSTLKLVSEMDKRAGEMLAKKDAEINELKAKVSVLEGEKKTLNEQAKKKSR